MQLRLSSRHPKGANGAVKSPVRGLRFPHWAMLLTYSAGLNAKCNTPTPFPLDLPDAQVMFDSAWSTTRVSGNQPAGQSHSVVEYRVVASFCCFIVNHPPAAFQIESQHLQGHDDPRHIVREVTRSPTFVHSGKFSLTVSMMFYASYMSNTSLFDSIMKYFLAGLTTILPGHDGPVFALPSGTESIQVRTGPGPYDGYVIVEGSAFLFSFNATAPAYLDMNTWINHIINFFRPKEALIENGDLLLNSTFTVQCGPSLLNLT